MKLRPALVPERGRIARVRFIGGLVLAVLVGLTWFQAPWTERLQAAWFDAHQALAPRQVRSLPVTVVEIDQKSLVALGQWPWPRNLLAQLIDAINRSQPAAIGVNILMPEADALSPERLLAQARLKDPALAAALQSLPSNDAVLARALRAAPDVPAGCVPRGPHLLATEPARAPPARLPRHANGIAERCRS